MADTGEARSAARDAVVRPLSRAAVRPCARPGCPSPARATLSFRYASREASLEGLADESSPATYDLCSAHADRTRPPSGWALLDHRPAEDLAGDESPVTRDLGDEHTVAVLAAALRAVPGPPAPAAPADQGQDEVVAAPVPVLDAVVEGLAELDSEDVDLDDLDLPEEARDEVRDALAELAAVARGGREAPEQIAIELDDEPARPAGDAAPVAGGAPAPRPVRAARERNDEAPPGGPARAW